MEKIKVNKVSFEYPEKGCKALKEISFSISRGEFITLCGRSGCGKTTLLRLLKPSVSPVGKLTGEITIDGVNITKILPADESLKRGFVMQSPENQIVTDKVWHELAFGLENNGVNTMEIRARVAETAAFFGIETWFHKKTAELSGGQKQMLCLASVMVMQPDVLILDEPTSKLDPISAVEFLQTVKRINSELGITVILSEHRLEEVIPLSDRIIVLDGGKVIADGTGKEVGAILAEDKHPMLRAMPTPMRVHGILDNVSEVPITVSEGRRWLESFLDTHSCNVSAMVKNIETESDETPAVEISDLYFRYDKKLPDVIKNMQFKAYSGRVSAILGGNGAGKSTALSLVAGLLASHRGEIRFYGEKISKVDDLYGDVLGYMPQDAQSLFAHSSVYLELSEMLTMKELSAQEMDMRIKNISELCCISSLLSSHPYDLSGGEQQRLAMAKILMKSPKILLLDEPTKGMDAHFKDIFGAILHKLKLRGTAIVMVSHDVEFCAEYADECSLFFDGNIISSAPSREFFANKSFYTTAANRMARVILPDAVLAEDIIAAFGGEIPDKTDVNFFYENEEEKKEKSKKPEIPLCAPKLSKNTAVWSLISLLLIAVTVYLGVFLLDSKKYYFLSLIIIIEAMLPFFLSFEKRKPRARELITLSVLCAIAVAGRAAFFMVPQFKPVVAVIIISGVAFGGECGFLVGAIVGFVSNFIFGQGPWAPWQMLALGLIGFASGALSAARILKNSRLSLSLFGFVATFVIYGGIMNPASVIMWQHNPTFEMFVAAYAAGVPFDIIHAASTSFFLWLISCPMLEKLKRIKIKYGILQ